MNPKKEFNKEKFIDTKRNMERNGAAEEANCSQKFKI
jgi:hypothetical protein